MPQEPGPAELILHSGKTLLSLASGACVSRMTVLKARNTNTWPRQQRTRDSLRRVLGLKPSINFPITINSVEECEAVLAALKPRDLVAAAHGGDSTAPVTAEAQP